MARKTQRKSKKTRRFSFNLKDERITKILGVCCFFLALYLFIAFSSYFSTWKFDQDKVLSLSSSILFDGEVDVQNWLGRLGAYVSHFFFYWGFGISSFLFIFLFIKLGIDLIKKRSLGDFMSLSLHTFLLICFISVTMEFIMRGSSFSWGGLMGYSMCNYLISFVGQVGLILLMVLLLIATFIWVVNPMFELQGVSFVGVVDKFNLPKVDSFTNTVTDWFRSTDELLPTKRKVRRQQKSDEEEIITLKPSESKPNKSNHRSESGGDNNTDRLPLDLSANIAADTAEAPLQPQSPKAWPKPKDPSPEKPQLELELEEPDTKPQVDVVEARKGPDMDSTKLYVEEENVMDSQPYDPTLDLKSYKPPTVDLLVDYSSSKVEIDREELEQNKNKIIKTLRDYKIEIVKIKATIGPTVTLYEIVPAPGIKISKIKSLENDIALSLSALGIRIIAPIPGKGTIGIEVPNKNKQMVSFREVVTSPKFQNAKMDLPIVLGKTISNEVFVADLAKMPHLLVAGATGQGKSVGINTILMSLLYKKHPSQVKLVMIDPKKVELFPYSSLDKHFLGFLPSEEEPIVTDTKKAIHTLNSLTIEMDERYKLLKLGRARNIKEYNSKFIARKLSPKDGHRFLPYIVLVIDEFADLIMTAGKEIELPIARLAQLARAIGIHLIIATQRPSVKIITGMIKANFPARISYKVTSLQDSRTILDSKGAEQLIGKGDMLLSVGSDIVRLQCAFVDTPEVENVIDHISAQRGFAEPFHLPEVVDENDDIGGSNMKWSDLDPMFEEAARLIVSSNHGSTSSIQRKLQLGYNRAGRIMDQLESLGIVGEANGSKPRQVLFTSEMELMHYFEHLKSNG